MKKKAGEVREDGMIFYKYSKTAKNGEYWVSKEKFEHLEVCRKKILKSKKDDLKNKKRILIRGTVREDGMIFWGYRPDCKNGEKWVSENNYKKFKLNFKKYSQERYKRKKDIHKKYYNEYYQKNKQKILKKVKQYASTHKEKISHNAKKRWDSDPFYKCKKTIRNIITCVFSKTNYTKRTKTAQIIGCSFEEFKSHIESQFKPGMSWENRHLWHIDHIMPVSMAKTYDEVVRLNHYKNLRPLWAHETRSKSDKTPETLVLF
jgi:hypothetical protein